MSLGPLVLLVTTAWRPDPGEARRLLREELAGPTYQPSPLERVQELLGWLQDRLAEAGRNVTAVPLTIGVAVLLAVIALLVVVLTRLRPDRRAEAQGVLHGSNDTAAVHRERARRALESGDLDAAVLEGLRALARSLTERGLVAVPLGATAREVTRLAASAFEGYDDRLAAAADLFDGSVYGGTPPGAAATRALLDLELELLGRAPGRRTAPDVMAVPR